VATALFIGKGGVPVLVLEFHILSKVQYEKNLSI